MNPTYCTICGREISSDEFPYCVEHRPVAKLYTQSEMDAALKDAHSFEIAEAKKALADAREVMSCGHPRACLVPVTATLANGSIDNTPVCGFCAELEDMDDKLSTLRDAAKEALISLGAFGGYNFATYINLRNALSTLDPPAKGDANVMEQLQMKAIIAGALLGGASMPRRISKQDIKDAVSLADEVWEEILKHEEVEHNRP